jgi:hypothetical protein
MCSVCLDNKSLLICMEVNVWYPIFLQHQNKQSIITKYYCLSLLTTWMCWLWGMFYWYRIWQNATRHKSPQINYFWQIKIKWLSMSIQRRPSSEARRFSSYQQGPNISSDPDKSSPDPSILFCIHFNITLPFIRRLAKWSHSLALLKHNFVSPMSLV